MSSPSHEHLLGYVLGALEPLEHEQIERELAKDPELARQVAVLTARLQPLECCRETEPTPAGLATRTCATVFAHIAQAEKVAPARRGVEAAMAADYGHDTSQWSLADLVVAAGIFLAAGMLFFPAIANSRYQAQRAQCQNNLRVFGEAVQQAQNLRPELELTNVASFSGNRGAAGIQASLVNEMGLLPRPGVMLCPSSPEAKQADEYRIPTPAELDAAQGSRRIQLYRLAAGSFALSLGYQPDADEPAPDSDFLALASDAPSGIMPNMVSSHHDGKGQNVVFISGRTAYVCGCGTEECGDSLFWNRRLKIEAGIGPRDSVLARGGTRSFSDALPVLNTSNH